jgi:hypothetical protein
MSIYKVFVIQNYDSESPEGRLTNITTLELIDTNLDKALSRAKQIMGKNAKKFYRIHNIIENFHK